MGKDWAGDEGLRRQFESELLHPLQAAVAYAVFLGVADDQNKEESFRCLEYLRECVQEMLDNVNKGIDHLTKEGETNNAGA